MLHRAHFDTLQEALDYAQQHGGWIAAPTEEARIPFLGEQFTLQIIADRPAEWFDASRWTLRTIMGVVQGSVYIADWRTLLTAVAIPAGAPLGCGPG